MKKQISYQKAGINFIFVFDQENDAMYVTSTTNQIWERGDYEYVNEDYKKDKAHFTFRTDDNAVRFSAPGYGQFYMKHAGKDINGVKIEDASVVAVIKSWLAEINKKTELRVNEMKEEAARREADRPSPVFDASGFVLYSLGCDTGLVLCYDGDDIMRQALKNGAEKVVLLRGERDDTNAYPGCMDGDIPSAYATKGADGVWTAPGYKYVYEQRYAVSREYFEAAREIVEAPRKAKEAERQAKFAEAKLTGQPVLLNKIVVPEAETPLRKDDEGDMVDVLTYAMPDGTTSTEYVHNY